MPQKPFSLTELRGFVGRHAILITRGVMKMLLDCIIRMWLLMPVENGSTWSLFLWILPDCKLVNDVSNELLDVDFICHGGFWHFLKLNGDIQVQLACSCSAGELRVTTRLSSEIYLRWQPAKAKAK